MRSVCQKVLGPARARLRWVVLGASVFCLAREISPGAFAQAVLVNASYDVAPDFYKEYNPLFLNYWCGWQKAQKDHFDEGAQFDRLMAAVTRH